MTKQELKQLREVTVSIYSRVILAAITVLLCAISCVMAEDIPNLLGIGAVYAFLLFIQFCLGRKDYVEYKRLKGLR